ncbi:MAG: nucleotidyltransferase, partial [Streptococcus sp.]|nr:nucleotidyltransferase [Streptococcus sp.]
CTLLPKQFEETIRKYFQLLYQPQQGEQAVVTLQTILNQLKAILP